MPTDDPRYINTPEQFDLALEYGPYAWPGGYPKYFLCQDGEALSFKAAQENAALIREAIASKDRSGWHVVGVDINWEDADLYCAHTNERIESAYAEDKWENIEQIKSKLDGDTEYESWFNQGA